MSPDQIVLAVAAGSLALNGFFLRGTAKDIKDVGGRVTELEKTEAIQDYRLHHLETEGE